ncbi:MAG: hypothetical protein HPY90_15520 [Syntrophothermus sp.]|uniref:hypothetical protein n=1 Tax=Syntrophothermus sp. TaxID=2736299 RepID=UPI002579EA99|nr:hypothetical protein [Syntrophothermus sp.]NSW84603.1 hypothetical protein [Syntrophothermus sp.]
MPSLKKWPMQNELVPGTSVVLRFAAETFVIVSKNRQEYGYLPYFVTRGGPRIASPGSLTFIEEVKMLKHRFLRLLLKSPLFIILLIFFTITTNTEAM